MPQARVCLRLLVALLLLLGSGSGALAQDDRDGRRDPHIQRDGRGLEFDREFLSPPTLAQPIYACSTHVTVKNFRKDARIDVFIDGAATPSGSAIGTVPELGVVIDLGTSLTGEQTLHATQTIDGVTSGPSNIVPVTSHREDYPNGLPRPRLFKNPLLNCGAAVLVEDVVPGSRVSVTSETARPDGTFESPVQVGTFEASTEWGHNWTGVSPRFVLGNRITAGAQMCTDASPPSLPEIVMAEPSPAPPGSLEEPLIEGADQVVAWGEANSPDPLQHGAIVRVYDGGTRVSESAVPGGTGHVMGLSQPVTGSSRFTVTQELCVEGPEGRPQDGVSCENLPAAEIDQPLPGDTVIRVTESVQGAQIVVFANGQEIGDSGGHEINLSRPLAEGEEVRVVQRLGDCQSELVYVIDVTCPFGDSPNACGGDWPAFRQSSLRHAQQTRPSPLADPYAVKTLDVRQVFAAPDGGEFTASPVVSEGRVFIGSSRGHLYALDADTLTLLWQFPPDGDPPLLSEWAEGGSACANPSSHGIAASVTVAALDGERNAVILGAPDRGRPSDPGGRFHDGLGSGRLFALDPASGAVIWMTSEPVARLTGITASSIDELHEQIGYSSPLVEDGRIYVGVADHCDNPIQKGRIVAVDLSSGAIDGAFRFEATSDRDRNIDRGGGVWTYVSGGLAEGIFATTGNTRRGNQEPAVNHGLSMIRLDPASGTLEGKLQPVPFSLDADPDWAAGVTLSQTSCGPLALSVMKDGWAYAGNAGPPLAFRWQFPSTAFPFPANDPNAHGDIRYHRAGAAWDDAFVAMMGGEDVVAHDTAGDALAGYSRLHALNVCAGPAGRVRWIADLDAFTRPVVDAHSWGLGPTSVSHGIVYVGTNRGVLVAIADPGVWPAQGSRCTWSNVADADCVAAGFQLVPRPTILRALDLGGSMQRNEPVLANGRVYIANDQGRLFMIAPR